jgi:hypothetical protein
LRDIYKSGERKKKDKEIEAKEMARIDKARTALPLSPLPTADLAHLLHALGRGSRARPRPGLFRPLRRPSS